MTGYYSRVGKKRGDSQAQPECINNVVGTLEMADGAGGCECLVCTANRELMEAAG